MDPAQAEYHDRQMDSPDQLLQDHFAGRIIRKDLTKIIKEGHTVPVYVLEFLLDQYCTSDRPEDVPAGLERVRRILAENYVLPENAGSILAALRSRGSCTVIGRISAREDPERNLFTADFGSLGVTGIPLIDLYPARYPRLLCGGMWCIVQLVYEYIEEEKKDGTPVRIRKLIPIRAPYVDPEELRRDREAFTKEEWMDLLLRSAGIEPGPLTVREKWLLLIRMVPLAETGYCLYEAGPSDTGKDHMHRDISPNSIHAGGERITAENLFRATGRDPVCIAGTWDCVLFDRMSGCSAWNREDRENLKSLLSSGSFRTGNGERKAETSLVFAEDLPRGGGNGMPGGLLRDAGGDADLSGSVHAFLPGWELPAVTPAYYTDGCGLAADFFAEFLRELRREDQSTAPDRYFRLGKKLDAQDTAAVRKTVSGLVKLVYPDGKYTKDQLEEILKLALEMRRRVRDLTGRPGGREPVDTVYSYTDLGSTEEHYVSLPEQKPEQLIPEGPGCPGRIHTVRKGRTGSVGAVRLDCQMFPGSGKIDLPGLSGGSGAGSSVFRAFRLAEGARDEVFRGIRTEDRDYILSCTDLLGAGMPDTLTLSALIALCSVSRNRPVLRSLALLGDIGENGDPVKPEDLADALQVCLECGAGKVLLPISSAPDLVTVPAELFSRFSLIFYRNAADAAAKALGEE